MIPTRLRATVAATLVLAQLAALPAQAFCGFYVAQADAKLFNKASKVVLARDGESTSLTMASDYQGDPKQFAVVIPVPTFIERKQIGIVEPALIDHLDRFSAPRLVEYFDDDPCSPRVVYAMAASPLASAGGIDKAEIKAKGVTVEASYEVGEYDIQILSATQSDGLVDYLTQNHYRIPDGATGVLGSYIKQGMHFFIAKINLERMQLDGHSFIRPLQVRYQSAKFMLPIRLGTVNANGPQDMVVLALTKRGRVETTNYRTVKIPTGIDVPLYVKDKFGDFYTAAFDHQVAREDRQAVFLEYAWNMGWCDPCAAEPLKSAELQTLGARWLAGTPDNLGGGVQGFVTRLHVRYDASHFPEDLQLSETGDTENFQGRYVLRHPFTGAIACQAGEQYHRQLTDRRRIEAQQLAGLTGWDIGQIRASMAANGEGEEAK